MARGESIGLQISLVIFVILTLILGVLTVLFFNNYTDLEKKLKEAKQDALDAKGAFDTKSREYETVLTMIGINPQETVENATKIYEADMNTYSLTDEPENRTYKTVLVQIDAKLDDAQRKLSAEQQTRQDLETQLAQREAGATQQRKAVEQDLEKALRERDQLAQAHADEVKQIQQDHQTNLARLRQENETRSEEVRSLEKKLREMTDEVKKASQRLVEFGKVREIERGEVSDLTDGEITWVDPRTGSVWINLGSADGVKEQQTFAVYPKGTLEVDGETPSKAAIEVTRVIKPHLAQGRITRDSIRDPVLAGDQIADPVFRPGSKMHVALGGFIDIEGDGRADNDALRRIIQLNGGVVDAEVTPDGNLKGPGIGLQTLYLVLGGSATGPRKGDIAKSTSRLTDEAAASGVKVITLDQFLAMLGYSRNSRVFKPGSGGEFKLYGQSGGGTAPRRPVPAAGGRKSAY